MKQTTSWQHVSSWYDQSLGNKGDWTHEHIVIPKTLALLKLPPDATILDLGCGQGIVARSLPPSVHYTGIDIAPSLVAAAKKRDTNPLHDYHVADITQSLPVPPNHFSHAVILLTLDNIKHPEEVLKQAARHLLPHGVLCFVINHPCFRIPRQSSWEIDKQNKIEYRRINRYMSPLEIPITMHPGTTSSEVTWTYHHPISTYFQYLSLNHFVVESVEEWVSDKKSVGKFGKMENRSRSEFPLFLAIKAIHCG